MYWVADLGTVHSSYCYSTALPTKMNTSFTYQYFSAIMEIQIYPKQMTFCLTANGVEYYVDSQKKKIILQDPKVINLGETGWVQE